MIRHEDLEWLEIAKRLEINTDVYHNGAEPYYVVRGFQ
jgi:hypothetical protein